MTSIIVLIILSLVISTLACTCNKKDITSSYCLSNFVGIVKIVSGPFNYGAPDDNCYDVKKIKAIKGDDVDVTKFLTGYPFGGCGVIYDVNEEYLVLNNVTDGIAVTSICQHGKQWSLMKDDQKTEEEAMLRSIQCS